jgi:hypothetical protein
LNTSDLEITRLKTYEITVHLRNALFIDTLYAIWGVGLILSEIKIAMGRIALACTVHETVLILRELSLVSRDKTLAPPHPKIFVTL